MLGAKVQPVPSHRLGRPDMQVLDRSDVVRTVNLQCSNDFRRCPYHQSVVAAVGRRGSEQVPEPGPYPLGMTVRDGREQHEFAGGNVETLLADSPFAQQHPLAAIQQRVYHRAPLFERGPCMCHLAARRRNGGSVLGGWRRGGRASSNRVVVAATSATAASKASALGDDG